MANVKKDNATDEAVELTARRNAIIEQWFDDQFRQSVVASSTAVWNHVHAAKEDLKRLLAKQGV